jgi:hypothetical protein
MARHSVEEKTLTPLVITPDGEIRYAAKKVGNTNKNAAYRRDSGATAQMTPDDITRHAVWRNRPKLALNIVAVDSGSPPVEIRDISLRQLIQSDENLEALASRARSATSMSLGE